MKGSLKKGRKKEGRIIERKKIFTYKATKSYRMNKYSVQMYTVSVISFLITWHHYLKDLRNLVNVEMVLEKIISGPLLD